MAQFNPLRGSNRMLLPNSRSAGPVDLSLVQSITVRVRAIGDIASLERAVYEQSSLPLEKRAYMTREELAKEHGARESDLDLVERYAQQHNLLISHRSAAERSIVLAGKLGNLLKAFPANVRMYHHANGTYRGRRGEISVPEMLTDVVTGIFGFDTRPKHRSPHGRKILAASGPGGENGLAATDFARRYNFPTSFQGETLDGSGQTIGIIELGGGYQTSDLQVFFQEIGVPMPAVSAVPVDRAVNNPSTPDSDDGEVMLDLEVAGAVAPNAKFVVYFAPNNGDKGFMDAISAAIHDTARKPGVISISWGGSESTTDQQGIDAFHELFVAASALGITVCSASGDHGTANATADQWDGAIHVNHPACDDFVLSCGGTQVNAQGEDVVWNDGTPLDENIPGGGGWATGGGISAIIPEPAYQQGAEVPVSLATGKPGRGVPDLAMSATNYFTRVDSSEGSSGGTSAVAPLMSALVALLNQGKKKNAGFMNPFLYANAAKGIFRDVTTGTNAIQGTAEGYKAGPGWDACTGLGTPDGTEILYNL